MIWHGKNEADPGHRWLREAMLGAIRQQGLGLDAGGGRPDTRQLDHAGNIA
jgi:hypothetical protein